LDFARGILAASGVSGPEIRPGKTSDFPTPAARPAYSALSTEKLRRETGFVMPGWEDALVRYFEKRREVHGTIDMETRSQ
jgi:dTDP-4-dehydrorhamnose reductase